MYSVKVHLDTKEIVVLRLSVSLVYFVGLSAIPVIGIVEKEASLPKNLPHLNFNYSSNVSSYTNTCADVGW